MPTRSAEPRPTDTRFFDSPVDFVVFTGLCEDDEVVFVEVQGLAKPIVGPRLISGTWLKKSQTL